MALLLVRVVLGGVILVQGGMQIRESGYVMGAVAVIAGGLLMAGLVTPIAAVASGVVVLVPCKGCPFDSWLSVVLGLTMLTSLVGLGPGAFSLDARVFGRRTIIIPARKISP